MYTSVKFQEKIQERLAVTPTLSPVSSPSSQSPKMVGKVIYPIGYGADPTGGQDSSDAILEALTDAFQLQTGLEMLPRVADLGGLVIDLQGGSYEHDKNHCEFVSPNRRPNSIFNKPLPRCLDSGVGEWNIVPQELLQVYTWRLHDKSSKLHLTRVSFIASIIIFSFNMLLLLFGSLFTLLLSFLR